MSLFGKLKNRLLKSSSKIDEGLEAIVADGGADSGTHEAYVEAVVADEPAADIPDAAPVEIPMDTPVEDPDPASQAVAPPAPLRCQTRLWSRSP